jgi:hypothetical protein
MRLCQPADTPRNGPLALTIVTSPLLPPCGSAQSVTVVLSGCGESHATPTPTPNCPCPSISTVDDSTSPPAQPTPYDRWPLGRSSPLKALQRPAQWSSPPNRCVSYRVVPLFLILLFHLLLRVDQELAGSSRGSSRGTSSAAMGSLGGGWRTVFPDGGIRLLGASAGVACVLLFISRSASDQFLSLLLLLLLQVAVVPGPAARSGFRRWTWRSRSLRPRLRRSSLPPVRCPLAASAPPVSVVPVVRLFFWF